MKDAIGRNTYSLIYPDRIVCVNISSTYDKNEHVDNYDLARHYWKSLLKKRIKPTWF